MFGERLKELREAQGLTQQQLAQMVNLSQQTIGHYEVGRAKPNADTLEHLADIFQTTVDYLLGRDTNRLTESQISEQSNKYRTLLSKPETPDLMADLPEEARQSITEYIDFVRKKYRKNPKKST